MNVMSALLFIPSWTEADFYHVREVCQSPESSLQSLVLHLIDVFLEQLASL